MRFDFFKVSIISNYFSLSGTQKSLPPVLVHTGGKCALSKDVRVGITIVGVDLLKPKELQPVEALVSLMAVYYIFDVCYLSVLKDTLDFMECFFLKDEAYRPL